MHETLPDWSDTVATFAEAPTPSFGGPEPDFDATAQRWAELCRRRIMDLDRWITDDHAGAIATFMSTRAAWRRQTPERAADQIYGPPYVE